MESITETKFPKYRQLLLALLANLLVSPFLTGLAGNVVASVLFFYAIFAVIKSLKLPKLFFSTYVSIALVAFCLQLLGNLGWLESSITLFIVFAQGIYSIFFGVSIYLIFNEIYTETRVTVDTLQGGICIYLMLGFLWALFYGMVSTQNVSAFSTPLLLRGGRYIQVIYFSFTILTTLGFGDIVPISTAAQVLTNVEAIIGQLYPTIFIALLVGGYLSQRDD